MSDIDTGELRALLAECDHGWRIAEQTHGEWYGIQTTHFAVGNAFSKHDAALIVAAVNALPALLDAADERDAAIRQARADAWDEGYDTGYDDAIFDQRGLSTDSDAHEYPHANPYREESP